ncbi:MAG: polymer-forming cytoskeletal protein [Desulfobacterales bacterium]|nr:polymer-forming cytoskeletal protein [Desulfobacterales bacterium]
MKKKKEMGSISTFLGPDSSIEGTLEFQGTIRLDGNVKGKIISNGGTVIVGENAVINAELIVDGAIIMGEVNGTIDAKERIEVYPPGRVIGDIHAPVIAIDTGAVFNGNCGMKPSKIATEKTQGSTKKTSVIEDAKRK